ncbi:MAG: macro domain-containing protein [Candidatus Thermoplasmatota archaeon]|nr:macro domain-containing protein [Candidatus Thermoplasmatota archaeon]
MISVILGDIAKIECDAIVNPANSHGTMGGGVALAIKRAGGQIIEDESVALAPTPVGFAVATTAGKLPCGMVIHAPTMTEPVERIGIDNVVAATRAALECALDNGAMTVAFPGMGTGVGRVAPSDAAEAMICEILKFEKLVERILLVARDEELYEAFRDCLERHLKT